MKTIFLLYFFFLHLFSYAQQLDPTIIRSMEAAIQNQTYPNIHSVLVSYNGNMIYENYWPGKDRKYGRDIRVLSAEPHGKDSLHNIASVSKSIVSACIGIALDQGKIKSIDQKVFDFFPEYASSGTGLKNSITIKDLLTMTAGIQWNEEDYNRNGNSEHLMDSASNPVGYVLSLPMALAPGEKFIYNSGATLVLAAILQKATGKTIEVFAREYLFIPIGISNFKWATCVNSNVAKAYGGLYLKSEDLLKFGLLYLHDGKIGTKQVISAGWVQQSLTRHVKLKSEYDDYYGFQWWLYTDSIVKKPAFFSVCRGSGGQYIIIDKAKSLVVVVTAGNYRQKEYSYEIFKDFILPALFKD